MNTEAQLEGLTTAEEKLLEAQNEPHRDNLLLNRVPYIATGAMALYFLFASIGLGVGTAASPQSGTWPLAVSIVLLICSLIGLIVANNDDIDVFGLRLVRPTFGTIVLASFILLFPTVGLIMSALIVMFLWFKFLAEESWLLSTILAVCGAFGSYLVFVVLLGAVFPPDLIAQLWGGR